MSDNKETYCRLCAEPTEIEQLISVDDDVGLHSNVASKMEWINIDVSKCKTLPKTICFCCFDQLERTWIFLHNVRNAQTKLNDIFCLNLTQDQVEKTGKPLNQNWQDFTDTKRKIKSESPKTLSESSIARESILKEVKVEPSDEMCFSNHASSSDSDVPIIKAAKKKKKTKKIRKKFKEEEENFDVEALELPILDMPIHSMTWDDFTWCCARCDAQCKTLDLLRLHSIENHSSCSSFKCSDCQKVIANYKSFLLHVRKHYQNLRSYCECCNKYLKSYHILRKHSEEHYTKHVCSYCGTSFTDANSLSSHVMRYAKKTKRQQRIKREIDMELKCDMCDRKFKSKANLQNHIATHTERRRDFACHICGRMFYTKGALTTHMATHEDTKPYKCEFCPLTFRARGNLNAHVTRHSDARPYVCEQCGRSFRNKKHLKSHSIVHTDLMPYPCPYCTKMFRFKTRLNLHVRQHTGAKPYNCLYCHRDFTNGSNYKKHMKRRHNIDTSVRNKNNVMINSVTIENCDQKVNITEHNVDITEHNLDITEHNLDITEHNLEITVNT